MWALPTSRKGSGRKGIAQACGCFASNLRVEPLKTTGTLWMSWTADEWADVIREKGGGCELEGLDEGWLLWRCLMIFGTWGTKWWTFLMWIDPAFSTGFMVNSIGPFIKPQHPGIETTDGFRFWGRGMILWMRMIFNPLVALKRPARMACFTVTFSGLDVRI